MGVGVLLGNWDAYLRSTAARMDAAFAPDACMRAASAATSMQIVQPQPWLSQVTAPFESRPFTKQDSLLPCPFRSHPQ